MVEFDPHPNVETPSLIVATETDAMWMHVRHLAAAACDRGAPKNCCGNHFRDSNVKHPARSIEYVLHINPDVQAILFDGLEGTWDTRVIRREPSLASYKANKTALYVRTSVSLAVCGSAILLKRAHYMPSSK